MADILIVDDQPQIREILSRELTQAGHEVRAADDMNALWVGLEHACPDLILLELHVNGFRGWQMLAEIRMKSPQVPILLMSARGAIGDDPFFLKTDEADRKNFFFIPELKEKIAGILGSKQNGGLRKVGGSFWNSNRDPYGFLTPGGAERGSGPTPARWRKPCIESSWQTQTT
jgi:CheY-like chemotaxis protein